jgi:UPF0755 protein
MFKLKQYLLIAIAVLAVFLISTIYVNSKVNSPLSKNNHQRQTFEVKSGQSFSEIADGLYKAKLISSARIFKFYGYKKGLSGKVKAGEFNFSPDMSMREILSELVGQSSNTQVTVRIIEGSTLTDIGEYLEKNNIVTKEDFLAVAKSRAQTFGYFGETPRVKSLEGYLFPDTYYFKKGVTSEQIIEKMLETMDKRLNAQMRADAFSKGKSIFDILTLASIVEKEVGRNGTSVSADVLDEERKNVAGIFYNRLNIGMALQSDATVTYITKKKDPSASVEDLAIDSPYNTYKHRGLPLGPISSPSLSSIMAAIYPNDNNYIYFLTKPDGTAVYARTLDEHNANKAKYLK